MICFHLYISDRIEVDLKSVNQEFILFLKLLNKHFIQYFTTVFLQKWRENEKSSKVSKQYLFK